jgi:hypothetical protein
MKEIGKLPRYNDLMLDMASLNQNSGKYTISLPIKEGRINPVTLENLSNSLRSLLDVVNKKQLLSFSISKRNIEEISWQHIIRKLIEIVFGKYHKNHHLY